LLGGRWLQFYEVIRPGIVWVGASSPVSLYLDIMGTGAGPRAVFERLLWMIGLQIAYGACLIALAVARLRPTFLKASVGQKGLPWAFWRRARRLLPRPACGDDALMWKERYVSRTTPLTKIMGGIVTLGLAMLLVSVTSEYVVAAFKELAA